MTEHAKRQGKIQGFTAPQASVRRYRQAQSPLFQAGPSRGPEISRQASTIQQRRDLREVSRRTVQSLHSLESREEAQSALPSLPLTGRTSTDSRQLRRLSVTHGLANAKKLAEAVVYPHSLTLFGLGRSTALRTPLSIHLGCSSLIIYSNTCHMARLC